MGSVLCCLGINHSEEEEQEEEEDYQPGPLRGIRICFECLTQLHQSYAIDSGLAHVLCYIALFPRERHIATSSDQLSAPLAPDSAESDSVVTQNCAPSGFSSYVDPLYNEASGQLSGVCESQRDDGRFKECCSEEDDVCPTCLEEYTSENPLIAMQCEHCFHLSCIYAWLERSATCPVCDQIMLFKEEPNQNQLK